jgi:hypothetical protein
MRRGERQTWRDVAAAADRIAKSETVAQEYVAKIALREAWASLYGIRGVSGIPHSGALGPAWKNGPFQ